MRTNNPSIVDIHAHVLPEIDDGARSLEEALEMVKLAQKQGVRHIIVTPHSLDGERRIYAEAVKHGAEFFEKELQKRQITVKISTGQEIFYFDGVLEYLKNGKFCTMASSSYVLLEFLPGVSWRELYQGVRKLLQARYWPIVAHAERYACLRETGRLEEIVEMGGYVQVNYSSLEGSFFDKDVRWCRKAVKEGNVQFFGTDMHHIKERTPKIEMALEWMEKKLSEERMRELLWENPQKILRGERLS